VAKLVGKTNLASHQDPSKLLPDSHSLDFLCQVSAYWNLASSSLFIPEPRCHSKVGELYQGSPVRLCEFSHSTAGSELHSSVPVSLWTTATASILSPQLTKCNVAHRSHFEPSMQHNALHPDFQPRVPARAVGGTSFPRAPLSCTSSCQEKPAPCGRIYHNQNILFRGDS
jgi:hypothetical protein